jgi:hypothetical protein
MRSKEHCTSALPAVKDRNTCAFADVQVSTSYLEKFEKELDHFLHAGKEDVFIGCETFHTCGGNISG